MPVSPSPKSNAYYPDGYHDVVIRVSPETRSRLNQMAAEYGFRDRNEFIAMLCKRWADGCLLLLDKTTKETLTGAAQEQMLKIAKRVARQETNYVLYELGFKATPYES